MIDNNIKEYEEEMHVEITQLDPERGERLKGVISEDSYRAHIDKRWVVVAYNEGGYNGTAVDLVELLTYVKENMPEIWPG